MGFEIIGEEIVDENTNKKVYIMTSNNKGSNKKRFRKPSNKIVVLEVLLGILMVKDIKLSEFAEKLGISQRMLQYYIYDGTKPTEKAMDKISKFLEMPKSILFYKKGD